MTGNFSRGFRSPFSKSYAQPRDPKLPASDPAPIPAADAEFERAQPVNRDDRRAMLRRHFEASGLTDEEIEAHMRNAKV
jgi:hypothetical protein